MISTRLKIHWERKWRQNEPGKCEPFIYLSQLDDKKGKHSSSQFESFYEIEFEGRKHHHLYHVEVQLTPPEQQR